MTFVAMAASTAGAVAAASADPDAVIEYRGKPRFLQDWGQREAEAVSKGIQKFRSETTLASQRLDVIPGLRYFFRIAGGREVDLLVCNYHGPDGMFGGRMAFWKDRPPAMKARELAGMRYSSYDFQRSDGVGRTGTLSGGMDSMVDAQRSECPATHLEAYMVRRAIESGQDSGAVARASDSSSRGKGDVGTRTTGGLELAKVAGEAGVRACDQLAAHPADPDKVGPGVPDGLLKPAQAIAACGGAVEQQPNEGRLHFQLGRALWASSDTSRREDAQAAWRVAADLGSRAALAHLAEIVAGKGRLQDPDPEEALDMLRRASEGGYKPAAGMAAAIKRGAQAASATAGSDTAPAASAAPQVSPLPIPVEAYLEANDRYQLGTCAMLAHQTNVSLRRRPTAAEIARLNSQELLPRPAEVCLAAAARQVRLLQSAVAFASGGMSNTERLHREGFFQNQNPSTNDLAKGLMTILTDTARIATKTAGAETTKMVVKNFRHLGCMKNYSGGGGATCSFFIGYDAQGQGLAAAVQQGMGLPEGSMSRVDATFHYDPEKKMWSQTPSATQ